MNALLGLVVLLPTLFVVASCQNDAYCTQDHGFYTTTEYCAYGCCGDYPNEECCTYHYWMIIVGVICGIIFLSCVIGVICCIVQQSGHRGQVVQPAPQTGVTTISYNTVPGQHPGMVPAQPYGPGYQQQLYGQPGMPQSQPPAYGAPGTSAPNPAFPPEAAATTAKKM